MAACGGRHFNRRLALGGFLARYIQPLSSMGHLGRLESRGSCKCLSGSLGESLVSVVTDELRRALARNHRRAA